MKTFRNDLQYLLNLLKQNIPFAIGRYGDGEYAIIKNASINLVNKLNGEFKYDPNDNSDAFYRQKLIDAYTYKHPHYYVGIACPCCVGNESFMHMKSLSTQDEQHLTWANLFVNGNYDTYVKEFFPEFNKKHVVMVVNKKANITTLPFKITKDFRVGTNCWKDDYGLIEEMKKYITDNQIKNHVFIFCAGPFSKMLVHQLFQHSPENTYIDAGSTLDPYLGLGKTRGYLAGAKTRQKICIWG